jgi:hypothetical protein
LLLGVGMVGLLSAEVLLYPVLAVVSSAVVVLSNLFLFAALPSLFTARYSLRELSFKVFQFVSKNKL